MFKHIYVENNVLQNPYAQNILSYFKNIPNTQIDKLEDIWGRVKKPYLQKRDNLNLFIGNKKGQLIKKTPAAYGTSSGEHYYFIHAYNCIYECEYCYLQGYFHTPDIVLFVNHDEIIQQMQQIVDESKQEVWFHAGEFSDSLALAHITGELALYWKFFKKNPKAKLELRTKSVNIKPILGLEPLKNIIVSFSLSPENAVKTYDKKTPSLKARLKAIAELSQSHYRIGIHFDPIIFSENTYEDYKTLLTQLIDKLDLEQLEYLSLGVVRFPKNIYSQVEKNYPDSKLLAQEFTTSTEGMVKYPRPMRLNLLKKIKNLCQENGIQEELIYFCMEEA